MDIANDHLLRRLPDAPDAPRSPDWCALRARLGAAHAARGALAGTTAATLPAHRIGSFAPSSAHIVDAWQDGLEAVNPNALSNGKGEQGKAGCTAGTPMAGG